MLNLGHDREEVEIFAPRQPSFGKRLKLTVLAKTAGNLTDAADVPEM